MSLLARLAVVAGVVLLLGAVAATFLPTSPQGATCGSWVDPEWKDDETDELVRGWQDLGQDGEAIGVRMVKRACDDALSTRRTVSLVLLGSAVVVPTGIAFVGGATRRRD